MRYEMLKRGYKHWRVTELQKLLGVEETGEFDEKTEAAVIAHQEFLGHEQTGEVGMMFILSLKDPDLYRKVMSENGHWWTRY